MYNPSRVSGHFSRVAHQYDAHAQLQRHVACVAAGMLAPRLAERTTVLDIGCGTGFGAQALSAKRPDVKVLGVDIAHSMCKRASVFMPTLCANAAQLPLVSNACDAVFSSLMLQWVEKPQQVVEEIHRILAPRSVALITTFGERTLQEMNAVFNSIAPAPRVSEFQSALALKTLFCAQNFHILQHTSKTYTHYHATLHQLMHELKAIGATNKRRDAEKNLRTKAFFERASALYSERYHHAGVVHATWQVHYFLVQKR